ncbi:PLP-dependent aminotransferase family protein [Ectobacillus panaciterrae]|uniref:aminotransferase-like domain-containing protein n=1 Tax=Ectobacillus panaciterrae TaxID=363872 RepID=UPI00040225AC|nr:PLP-dependent aminotransferase family protein [Ectobacillus panaciterrae]
MQYKNYFPENIKSALANDPPGSWMPSLPTGCIRLSAGYPAPNLVPTNQIKSAVDQMIQEEQDLPFHYLGSPRINILKHQIQHRLVQRSIQSEEQELLITSGASQAIDLIARTLLDQQAVVAVEAPTYMEALEIFRNYTKQIISIPMDEFGIQTNVLEAVLTERKRAGLTNPCLLYTIPSFHNPTGSTMTTDRRQHLLALATKFDFLLIEDDAYGELSFSESPFPLKTYDVTDRVLYVGSLSKVVAPGMRIGWILGPKMLLSAISWFKKDLDHPFAHATMSVYIQNIEFEERLDILRDSYRVRRDAMIQALKQYMPKWVTWHVPNGGFFVWLHVENIDTAALLKQALEKGVSYIPGKHFFVNPTDGLHFLRLSFSFAELEEIIAGVQKLGNLLRAIQ